ncbi:MAG: glycosyltransferase [Spirulina sp. SIO3F2]|nr:glycosyltransferase [Spirulina sp. SIO3F2]
MPTTLIVFTRSPEPGKTKTRLIPALGPDGAANLQRQMTEHTLRQAQIWQEHSEHRVEVHFTGSSREQMQQWLGSQWYYLPQAEGGLGDRLASAIQPHLTHSQGQNSVLVIGIDCPGINPTILSQATTALTTHDIVLGPTTDGGYYLIGLRQWQPSLFADIAWSTDQVFKETCDRAQQLHLTVATLALLRDVDYPEDLEVWDAIQAQRG